MKSGGWQLHKLSSTRYSEIVFYVLTVVLSYSLYHLFTNTQRGARFADKTRQALAFEQLRTQRTVVYLYRAGNSVARKSGTIPPYHDHVRGTLPWYRTSFSTS